MGLASSLGSEGCFSGSEGLKFSGSEFWNSVVKKRVHTRKISPLGD